MTIGGCSYVPPLPIESVVKERLDSIIDSGDDDIDIAIKMCMYAMRTQVFIDGNKRASVIFSCYREFEDRIPVAGSDRRFIMLFMMKRVF